MRIRIRSLPDFVAGAFFVAIGLAVAWLAGEHPIGNAQDMGPGYFPRLLGTALALLGTVVAVQALARRTPEGKEETFALRRVLPALAAIAAFWILLATVGKTGYTGLDLPVIVLLALAFFASRPAFWVLAGVGAFGALLQSAGLVAASFALVMLASLASREFHWKVALAGWAVLLALCLVVFVWGLHLPFPVLPAGLAD